VGTANGHTAQVTVHICEGGVWGATFNPALVNESQWGTGIFSASNCQEMHIILTPNVAFQAAGYTNLEYDPVRLTNPLAPCPSALPD